MKNLFILFFLFSSYTFIAQNSEWHKTKDLEAAFSVEFPSKPKKSKREVPTDKGSITMHSYEFYSNDDSYFYMTSFTKYPNTFFSEGLDTLDKRNEVLENTVNGAVTNSKGTLLSKSEIVFNGYNGRDIKIALESGGMQHIVRMKVILAGFKLYIAQIVSEKESDDNLNSKRFFNSFELLNVRQ